LTGTKEARPLTYTRVEDWKAAFILAYSINIGAPPEAE